MYQKYKNICILTNIYNKNNKIMNLSKQNVEENSAIQPVHKSKQLVQMLSFRVMPAYFREIEKVAEQKNMTVSKLIRTYIKEGMKRDGELSREEDKLFTV